MGELFVILALAGATCQWECLCIGSHPMRLLYHPTFEVCGCRAVSHWCQRYSLSIIGATDDDRS